MTVRRVALLTAGGLAPCLSSAVGGLIERYSEIAPDVEILCYLDGYAGLLAGRSFLVTPEGRAQAGRLHAFGGSPIGNSRVKLTNAADLVKRGLVAEGDEPLKAAADRLEADGVDVLHTIGGDDTNTTAADLAAFLALHDYDLTVVGMPKTVDNDIIPIRQSLGAWTAAEQGAVFARNILSETTSNPRMLIVHEVMGRHCGWLTAATAKAYRDMVAADIAADRFAPALGADPRRRDVHGIYVPELDFEIATEADRLTALMDELGGVNLFVSEGAGVGTIVAELEARGETVQRDPFGHVKLDTINPGAWFAKQFAAQIGAEKTMVQKSGYFSRSAAANPADLRLIKGCTDLAVECGLRGEGGVIGHDEERGNVLRAIEFERIKGGKPFDVTAEWFVSMMAAIGQPIGPLAAEH